MRHETVVYPGAPHGFFDRRAEQHHEAADDAWNRTLAFIRRHTMGQPIAATAPAASSTAADAKDQPEPLDPRIGHFTGDD